MEANPWAPGRPSASAQKDSERQRIARKTQEFIKSGGRIESFPPGHSAYVPKINNRIKRVEG